VQHNVVEQDKTIRSFRAHSNCIASKFLFLGLLFRYHQNIPDFRIAAAGGGGGLMLISAKFSNLHNGITNTILMYLSIKIIYFMAHWHH